jgi:Rrf2 family protein
METASMAHVLNISEAATLALHATVLLASRDAPMTTKGIASALRASEAHLSKVMQRLARAGLVNSSRGPKGGFVLSRESRKIALLDVYQAIEGRLAPSPCLLGHPVCAGRKCIMGSLVRSVNRQISDHLSRTTLSELTSVIRDSGSAS